MTYGRAPMDVLVVCAHPQSDSFTHAIVGAVERGLATADHHATVLDLYALGFGAAMSAEEHRAYHGDQPVLDPMVAEHAALVQRAQTLVFVYPTWWNQPPAILRGWMERVLVPGVAFTFDAKGKVQPGMSHVRRIIGISTYGAHVDVRQAAQRRRTPDDHAGAADELRAAHADDLDRPLLDGHRRHRGPRRVPRPRRAPHGPPARGPLDVRTLVVYCHPDPGSFTAAARDRAVEALRRRGDEVRVTDLYAEGFDPVLSREERARHLEPGPHPSVAHHAADLQWCHQLVLIYPTWWSGQPAMMKGWFDRVWVHDVAFDLRPDSNRIRPRLRNVRRLVAITTHGSSKLVNAVEGEVGKRMVTRTMRATCHPLARTRWIAMYGIDTATDAERTAFLDRVARKLG